MELAKINFERNTVIGTTGGAAVGAWLGSSVGIAALGTATSGIVPLAIVGAYGGYRLAKYLRNRGGPTDPSDTANLTDDSTR